MKTASVNRLYTQRQSMGMCVLYVAVICFLAIVAAKMTIEFLDIFKSMDFHLEEMLRQESEVVPAGHTSSSRTKSLASLKTASNHPSTSPFGQANYGNLDTIQTFLRPVLEKWMVKSEGRQKDPLLRVSQPFGRKTFWGNRCSLPIRHFEDETHDFANKLFFRSDAEAQRTQRKEKKPE